MAQMMAEQIPRETNLVEMTAERRAHWQLAAIQVKDTNKMSWLEKESQLDKQHIDLDTSYLT